MKDETIAVLPKRHQFKDQASVDAFKKQYPAVKKIIGDLHFYGAIHDFSAFSQVEEILGCLFLRHVTCKDLSSFSKLKIIGGELLVCDTEHLISLRGLENLTTLRSNGLYFFSDVEMGISIEANKNLVDISALRNLTKTSYNLHIAHNPKLETLEGLNNFQSVGRYLVIDDNKQLKDISALSKLTQIRGDIVILNNTNLNSYKGLENIHKAGEIRIKSNGQLPDVASFTALQKYFK